MVWGGSLRANGIAALQVHLEMILEIGEEVYRVVSVEIFRSSRGDVGSHDMLYKNGLGQTAASSAV